MAILLTRRAVVQAAIESTYGTPIAVGVGDGVLCSEPMYTVAPNVLTRDFVSNSLSKKAHIIGRKLSSMTFSTELRGNGKQQSGNLGDAPIISRLMRACGYELAANTINNYKGPYFLGNTDSPVSWAVDVATADATTPICYYIEVTTGGASGTAQITVTSDTLGEGTVAGTITTTVEEDLGTHGLAITPTFSGSLTLGQRWVIWLLPAGIAASPISDDFESITLVMYKDGVKHVMPGAFGTFEIEATAGDFAKINWTFTGLYVAPTDNTMPTPTYERTLPSQVELARLRIDGFYAIVEKFTFNQGNDIQVRPDVSSADGYIGTRLVARSPEGGINPEADTVANQNFWSKMATAERMPFQMRVGTATGNTVWFLAPGVQYTGLTYQDRNGILSYDAGLSFPFYQGDDENFFFFC